MFVSAKVNSIGLKGLEGYLVQVQVEVMKGVDSVIIVGLPDASVRESRERVSPSLHHMGHSLVDLRWVPVTTRTMSKDERVSWRAISVGLFLYCGLRF